MEELNTIELETKIIDVALTYYVKGVISGILIVGIYGLLWYTRIDGLI